MPKKQTSQTSKWQKKSSFLTPEFLGKQKEALKVKLADCQSLQRLLQEGIKICSPDDRRGDVAEQAFTFAERQTTAQQLERCGKTTPQIARALDLIDNSLACAGGENGEYYGICISCKKLMSEKRLTAVPEALRCVPCQEKEDAQKR